MEKYIVDYLDTENDNYKVLYFNTKEEATCKLNELKRKSSFVDGNVFSETQYEELEMELLEIEEYGNF